MILFCTEHCKNLQMFWMLSANNNVQDTNSGMQLK